MKRKITRGEKAGLALRGRHLSPTTEFQKGHPPYRKDTWIGAELKLLKQHYAKADSIEFLSLLPKRSYGAIRAKARKLGLWKDKEVRNKAAGQAIKKRIKNNPQWQATLKKNGLRLAQSPYHHRRVCGEYTLPQESRDQISKTLIKTYKEHPEIKRVACKALEKGRLTMGLAKGPTEPERKVESLLNYLNIKAIPQYRFNGFFLDFALPERKLAILVDGCYWHCCPIHFPMAATKTQQHNLTVDKKREKILKRVGWRVLHIWEHEVNEPATLEHLRKEVILNP